MQRTDIKSLDVFLSRQRTLNVNTSETDVSYRGLTFEPVMKTDEFTSARLQLRRLLLFTVYKLICAARYVIKRFSGL